MDIITQMKNDTSLRNTTLLITALFVVLVYSSFIFGGRVFLVALVAVVIGVIVEFGFHRIRKSPFTLTVLITPLLITLLVPPTLPLWMAGVGSFFGVFFAKSVFGGDGAYIFNPAVAGILFLLISFPAQMSTMWLEPVNGQIQTFTPLNSLPFVPSEIYSFNDLLFGFTSGAIGETVRFAILLLGLGLMAIKAIDWKLVLSFLASFFVLQVVFNLFAGPHNPVYAVLTGTTIFAAVFLVPDPTVAPNHPIAKVIYAAGIALITIVIRMFAAFPEGIIFALIIMSAVSPLLDSMFQSEVTASE